MQNLYLRQLEVGPMENFVYLIGNPQTREALVIDPAWQVDTILKEAEKDQMNIIGAIASHHHGDHTNGLGELLKNRDIPVYVHQKDSEFVKAAQGNIVKTQHDQEIQLGDLSIRLLHTPGHTPGSQCVLIQNHLCSGDTLFINGCGRCDLPGGNAEDMYYTLTQKLMRMKDDIILLPGHNYAEKPQSTLGEEKMNNPYLKRAAESLKNFLALRMQNRRKPRFEI